MTDEDINQLGQMREQKVRMAWVHEGTFFEILSIHTGNGEAKGVFRDGKYVDLYNVEPENVILFNAFVPDASY